MATVFDIKTDHIVGVIILESKKLHGHTNKGLPIYTFVPLSHHYPPFLVPSSCREKINQLAVIQYVEWPDNNLCPIGTCIRLIGRVDDISAYDLALLIKNGLNNSIKTHRLPSVAEPPVEIAERPVFPKIIVIDPEGSTDCDDGFHIDDKYLYVHIADVDHYFNESGPYESELRKRVTSIYSLNKVYHMLPETYASDIISLNKKGIKYAMTVIFRLNDDVCPVFEKVIPSMVNVSYSMSYEKAQNMMDYQDLVDSHIMLQLYKLSTITGTRDTHKMIEKIMIWTNEAIAKFIYSHGANLSVYCPSPSVAVNIPEDLRRFGPRAIYSVDQHGHGMMGLEHYTHFTSPIRRYADLVVHRLVKHILSDIPNDPDRTRETVNIINDVTSKSKRYYRDLDVLKLTQILILNTSHLAVGYIIDIVSNTNKVNLYIKDMNIVLHAQLFANELLSIWTVSVHDGIITITDKQGHQCSIPLYQAVDITLTCLPEEIRLNRKIRVSFPVISSGGLS